LEPRRADDSAQHLTGIVEAQGLVEVRNQQEVPFPYGRSGKESLSLKSTCQVNAQAYTGFIGAVKAVIQRRHGPDLFEQC
jgi:hypothetical protein